MHGGIPTQEKLAAPEKPEDQASFLFPRVSYSAPLGGEVRLNAQLMHLMEA